MRTRVAINFCLLTVLLIFATAYVPARSAGQDDYGPEVKAFLDFLRQEEAELEFQINHNEITRRDYARAKNRIAVHRQTVLDMARESGEDYVPEIHVVAPGEVSQLIEDGLAALRRVKRGDVIAEKWRYRGSVTRGELFYIFERLTPQ
jgi:hypothetical protein